MPVGSVATILTNARIVMPDAVVHGTVTIDGSDIGTVDDRVSAASAAVDCAGDYLLPGLVDMHTDNVEKYIFPRPTVRWPSVVGAVVAHDVELVGAGITTVFDSLSLGDFDTAGARRQILPDVIDAITAARTAGALRADHYLHFRCELPDEAMLDLFEPRADHPLLRLVSLMDHTPGHRQYRDPAQFRAHRQGRMGRPWSDAEFADYLAERQDQQRTQVPRAKDRVRAIADARGLPLASHDDTTVAHVEEAHADGVTIAEFPTTAEAARHARALGIMTVVGSPNVVLGKSHSGNVSARALVADGLLDGLTSDYFPGSLLEATFALARDLKMPLHATVFMASGAIAERVGFPERGRLQPGCRADLVRVRLDAGHPVVRAVWRSGERIY